MTPAGGAYDASSNQLFFFGGHGTSFLSDTLVYWVIPAAATQTTPTSIGDGMVTVNWTDVPAANDKGSAVRGTTSTKGSAPVVSRPRQVQ